MSQYCVGIDLGTTHCVVSYADISNHVEAAGLDECDITLLTIPQWTDLHQWSEQTQLPSFLYQFHATEFSASDLQLPWQTAGLEKDHNLNHFIIGDWARSLGELNAARVISSAKSWLSSQGALQHDLPLLPVCEEDVTDELIRLSPVEALQQLLSYIADVWGARFPGQPLSAQRITITIPASFDPLAKNSIAEIAAKLQFQDMVLLEEPQAAAYHWLYQTSNWREQIKVGDTLLVVDLGGGTTDFSLISAREDDQGALLLERVAVGDHLLLGGDNMDLAVAYAIKQQLAAEGKKIKISQMPTLIHQCRVAKEQLFNNDSLQEVAIALPERGAKLLGKTLRTQLTRSLLHELLIEGFFPQVSLEADPVEIQSSALSRVRLPYAQDVAITRHLAGFLKNRPFPTKLLLNGGVFKASCFTERLMQVFTGWAETCDQQVPELLDHRDLDAAVAIGASYYRVATLHNGVRIRGGVAQSYYVGIESSAPAVPGIPPAQQALCVVAQGMEEGSGAIKVPRTFYLKVGLPAKFHFFGSTVRACDVVGDLLDEDETEALVALPDISVQLTAPDSEQAMSAIPVQLSAEVTEVGTLEIAAIALTSKTSSEMTPAKGMSPQRWKVSLDVRSADANTPTLVC